MTKELSYVMLELQNVKMEPSNMRKKTIREREPLNVIKVQSHMMLGPSNVRKK